MRCAEAFFCWTIFLYRSRVRRIRYDFGSRIFFGRHDPKEKQHENHGEKKRLQREVSEIDSRLFQFVDLVILNRPVQMVASNRLPTFFCIQFRWSLDIDSGTACISLQEIRFYIMIYVIQYY